MKRAIIKFGVITGTVLSLFLIIGMLSGSFEVDQESNMGLGEIIGFSGFILAFVFVYFGIRSYRDKERDGTINFFQALGAGLLISIIASLMYALTWDVYIYTSNPKWYEQYADAREATLKKSETFSEEDFTKLKKSNEQMIQWSKNPIFLTGMTMLEPLPVGVLAALLSAAFLRRKASPASE